eukprot:TRINITY_DN721_c0_g1_i1.p1 TRINITY_DN721_c0_g1~~TRINITY_DN721_c0_g1_i1.p1  ORF type:complete len:390 (-),score=72.33 TRINITY_DN721_c0_g1_i1:33-1202(-)
MRALGAFTKIDRSKLKLLINKENQLFEQRNPKSLELYKRSQNSLLGGVPMHWMIKWAGKFPVFVTHGKGQYFYDVDKNEYLDLCLGDTGAMTGHAPEGTLDIVTERIRNGITFMLPTEDSIYVGEELQKRFKMKYWQVCLTATDANRFSLRLARHVTGRPKVLVFNWCYHGTVDETFVVLDKDGKVIPRPGGIGPQVNPALTSKVVEFNDLKALDEALSTRDVACLLAEPAMTNIGIIHPNPGYWEEAQKICKKHGTLLIIDETHTICAGPGGYTTVHNLNPDMFVIGKPIAGGIPVAVYGFSEHVAGLIKAKTDVSTIDTGGIGGTLSGNALSTAAMRAVLSKVLTQEAYDRTIKLSTQFTEGVQSIIDEYKLPWSITQYDLRAVSCF